MLHPPDGAFHEPIKPEQIVVVGESMGGQLAAALLVLLQYIQDKKDGRIEHGGGSISIPMPAGYAAMSPHLDYTSSQ